jgi:hypothetical protein
MTAPGWFTLLGLPMQRSCFILTGFHTVRVIRVGAKDAFAVAIGPGELI